MYVNNTQIQITLIKKIKGRMELEACQKYIIHSKVIIIISLLRTLFQRLCGGLWDLTSSASCLHHLFPSPYDSTWLQHAPFIHHTHQFKSLRINY